MCRLEGLDVVGPLIVELLTIEHKFVYEIGVLLRLFDSADVSQSRVGIVVSVDRFRCIVTHCYKLLNYKTHNHTQPHILRKNDGFFEAVDLLSLAPPIVGHFEGLYYETRFLY
jgi:hypothetical protein